MKLYLYIFIASVFIAAGCSRDWDEPLLIAYDDGTYIFTMDENGSNVKQLAAGTNPCFSPDGEEIVYWRSNNFYILNIETGNERLLTAAGGYRCCTWSPDGTKIAFINAGYLYTIDSGGANLVQVSASNINQVPITWSADSETIACSNSAITQIYYYTLGTTPSVPSFSYGTGITGLAFSPFDEIAYTDGSNFYIASTDFLSPVIMSAGGGDTVPSWSPDGKQLVYVTGSGYIMIMDSESGLKRQIAGPNCYNPCFQGKPH